MPRALEEIRTSLKALKAEMKTENDRHKQSIDGLLSQMKTLLRVSQKAITGLAGAEAQGEKRLSTLAKKHKSIF